MDRTTLSNKQTAFWLLMIVGLAAYVRIGLGLYWDEMTLLHPDERFLTMVTHDISLPSSIGEYFDSSKSPLSPYNKNFGFFVYGTFPIFLTKLLTLVSGVSGYPDLAAVGRIMAAGFDIATIIMIYLIGARLYGRQVGILAAFLLAISVQNIQLSHFYGVENPTAFFITLTFFFLSRFFVESENGSVSDMGRSRILRTCAILGVTIGLALASKISGLFFFPIIGLCFFIYVCRKSVTAGEGIRHLLWFGICGLFLCAIAGLMFRIFQPYAFGGDSFWHFAFSPKFISNMKEVKSASEGIADMPPQYQWVGRAPFLFSIENMFKWHAGPVWSLLAWGGTALCLFEILFLGRLVHVASVAWVLFWFSYSSTGFTKAGRYLSIIYPFFALHGAYLLARISVSIGAWLNNRKERGEAINPYRAAALPVLLLLGCWIWTNAFLNIYRSPQTRIAASRWMFANIPCGAVLGGESWDDGLPLRIDKKDPFGGCYKGVEFNHIWVDDEKKLVDTLSKLEQVEYIILSSNRGYLSIPRLPRRFPFTVEYYRMLFSGELGFTLIKKFTSYPRIGSWQFNDDYAEETFTVYDHPAVLIFKKSPNFRIEHIKERLSAFTPGVHLPLMDN